MCSEKKFCSSVKCAAEIVYGEVVRWFDTLTEAASGVTCNSASGHNSRLLTSDAVLNGLKHRWLMSKDLHNRCDEIDFIGVWLWGGTAIDFIGVWLWGGTAVDFIGVWFWGGTA